MWELRNAYKILVRKPEGLVLVMDLKITDHPYVQWLCCTNTPLQKYLHFVVKIVAFKTHVNWGAAGDGNFGAETFHILTNAILKTRKCRS
jgi:hypothetical protein